MLSEPDLPLPTAPVQILSHFSSFMRVSFPCPPPVKAQVGFESKGGGVQRWLCEGISCVALDRLLSLSETWCPPPQDWHGISLSGLFICCLMGHMMGKTWALEP